MLALVGVLAAAQLDAAPISCENPAVANTDVLGAALAAGCQEGSLVFDRFTLNFVPATGGAIWLSSLGTQVLTNEVDLGFQIVMHLPPADAIFWYRIVSPDANITGVNNFHNGTGQTQISEVACDAEPLHGICPSGHVLGSFTNPPNDSTSFKAQSVVWVIKDIGTSTAGDGISFFINSAEMSPSGVPEPGTMAMLGLGLIGVCAVRKRKVGSRNKNS